MMKWVLAALTALLIGVPGLAHAACEATLPDGLVMSCTTPSWGSGWLTAPVGASSAAITTGATFGVNSPASSWPQPGAALPGKGFIAYVQLGSAGPVTICPRGGTCTPAAGIEVGPGASKPFLTSKSTVIPTAISPLGGTVEIRW